MPMHLLLWGVIWLCGTVIADAQREFSDVGSPESSLVRIREAYQSRPQLAVEISRQEKVFRFADGDVPSEPRWNARYSLSFLTDGERVDITSNRFRDMGQGEKPYPGEDSRKIWDRTQWWEYYLPITGASTPDGSQRLHLADTSEPVADYMARGNLGTVVTGVLYSDLEPFYEVLQAAEDLSVRRQMMDGESVWVLEGSTDSGRYEVWVDPDRDFLIRKAAVRKQRGDLAWGNPLGQAKGGPLAHLASDYDRSPSELLEFTLDGVEVGEVDGRAVITSASETTKIFKEIQQQELKTVELNYTNWEFDPDFEARGAFEMEVPNGTRVINEDSSRLGLTLQWQDGGIIPYIPREFAIQVEEMLEDLTDAQQTQGTKSAQKDTESPNAGKTVSPLEPGIAPNKTRSFTLTFVVAICLVAICAIVALAWKMGWL